MKNSDRGWVIFWISKMVLIKKSELWLFFGDFKQLYCMFWCVNVCASVFVRLLPVQPSCWLWTHWPWPLRGAVLTHMCLCVPERVCMHAHGSTSVKAALGPRSHQLLIKLVSRSSTSMLTDVTDAGQFVFVCIQAAAVDMYTISAEFLDIYYRYVRAINNRVYVCLQSSTDTVSLIINIWQLKLQPPQLTSIWPAL